jgi:hypothetical protein
MRQLARPVGRIIGVGVRGDIGNNGEIAALAIAKRKTVAAAGLVEIRQLSEIGDAMHRAQFGGERVERVDASAVSCQQIDTQDLGARTTVQCEDMVERPGAAQIAGCAVTSDERQTPYVGEKRRGGIEVGDAEIDAMQCYDARFAHDGLPEKALLCRTGEFGPAAAPR